MSNLTEYEVFIATMGTLPDGSQCLASATDQPLTEHYWDVWVIARTGDESDELEDLEFPLDAYEAAHAKACELAKVYDCGLTEL